MRYTIICWVTCLICKISGVQSFQGGVHRPIFTYAISSSRTRLSMSSPANIPSPVINDIDVESTTINVSKLSGIQKSLMILYKFSRPHTIKGTILASFMGVSRALMENPSKITLALIPKAVIGLFALLCGNAYIVGLNQIYDVKIDEINKPFLPIAAKLMSPSRAWQLVIGCLLSGIGIVATQFSPQIFALYILGVILGTVYSVPPFHFKRYPLLAGGTIAIVRGFLLNFGVYYAVREALSIPFMWNPVVAFISAFMTVFASVIAVTKDLPDVEGDVKYNISTFASKYGVKKIADGASFVLASTYVAAIGLPFILPGAFKILPMVAGHSAYLAYFLWSYSRLDPNSMNSVKVFYKSIWNLFYLEYCLYPFI